MSQTLLHVQLYAGPSVGKSATALGLAYHLKLKGIHCEIAYEYAKKLVYLNKIVGASQKEIMQGQIENHMLLVKGGVHVIITDSPIPLSLAYCNDEQRAELMPTIIETMKGWNTLNILLTRDLRGSYQQEGRYQTEEEAIAFARDVFNPWARAWMKDSLIEVPVDANVVPTILSLIESKLATCP